MDMVSSYGRHIYQVFSCGLHISCIERNWLPFSKCCITFDKSYDNFWRGNVFFRNLKDSCDGSGLNTSKSSKGSCPYFRYCWVVMLSNFHKRWIKMLCILTLTFVTLAFYPACSRFLMNRSLSSAFTFSYGD